MGLRLRFIAPDSFVVALTMAGCTAETDVFTLYRNSPIDKTMRIHVATFNARAGEKYNAENCDIAAGLFVAQGGVTVRYWCERGPFKP